MRERKRKETRDNIIKEGREKEKEIQTYQYAQRGDIERDRHEDKGKNEERESKRKKRENRERKEQNKVVKRVRKKVRQHSVCVSE